MTIRKIFLSLITLMSVALAAHADKGMWLLNELNKENEARMRELGFELPMSQLYSLDGPSVASAVVIFGGGCTGITVSEQGLIFTNHHCGYESIQSQSTVDHDYLKDGFVSQSLREELPIPGLEVRYLKNIVDVTSRINQKVANIKDEKKRSEEISKLSETIAKEYSQGKHIEAQVIPYYAGNKYYVVVYTVFTDVRMVMAPPSSVGKFGGDTDNWMWPRHTGDFSVFRVYADAKNNPADYDKNNKPYKPVSYAPVSMKGYKENDFAMTIGFPGSTDRYLTSWGIQNRIENENDPRIEVRGMKQEIWKKSMLADQATRIKYDSKYASSSNYWKNSIGMNRGLAKLAIVDRKRNEESVFSQWVKKNNRKEYVTLLSDMEATYTKMGKINKEMTYLSESMLSGTEIITLGYMVANLLEVEKKADKEALIKEIRDTYKDYLPSLDKQVLPAMLEVLRKNLSKEHTPEIYNLIDNLFAGNYQTYANSLFENSFIPYQDKFEAFLKLTTDKQIEQITKDPLLPLIGSVLNLYFQLNKELEPYKYDLKKFHREYFAAMREADPKRLMPSDANFTMRMSYGSIVGYQPYDGAQYHYYTTSKGVLQKQDPNSSEFKVQPEILDMMRREDFGRYKEGDEMRLCFLSTNDITGGNSGSPVFNGKGQLIGLAFDGNWEAMSGDIEFEPDLQRTISVDIRYVLFMIDKWAKCPRLVQELKLV